MRLIKYNICTLIILIFLSGTVFAKNRIYLANNTAAISISPNSESSANLEITLKPQDNFNNWSFGFFMLYVFLSNEKPSFTAQICKQSYCVPLVLDIVSDKPATNIADYLKPELSSGHITLFKPARPFKLEDGNTYTININGLKRIPKNITAMPQNLFIVSDNHENITPLNVTGYTGHGYAKDGASQRNKTNWYILKNPQVIDSIVVPYPQKTTFVGGETKVTNVAQVVYDCHQLESAPQCLAIKNQAEGYVLQIITSGITIYSNTAAGVFYARATLAQLANYYNNAIPNQTVIDYPRFKYRGFMLDTVRHFFTVSEIKQLLDVMAAHKLNVLRLHIADDEAWRIQLPHYPQLTNIGSKRVLKSVIGPSNLVDEEYDITNFSKQQYAKANTLYQGYYTIADIKELIVYANARQITIIPEIEMPGHTKVLKKSMPEIFFDANDRSRYFSVQGYNDSVLPICKYGIDSKFTAMLNGIIIDIAGLFALQTTINYVKNEVSLSGDEVPKEVFTNYAACNEGVYKGLTGESITHQFFKQLSNNLPGYKLSGYQQLVQSESGMMNENAIQAKDMGHIWQWQPTNHLPVSGLDMSASLSKARYPTVLNFANLTYFDMRYSSKWEEPGLYWSANQTDTFSALISGWSLDHISDTTNILGLEGSLWTELVPSREHLFYMILPKMSGLADAAWSDKKDLSWRSLAVRLGCGKTGFLDYLNKRYNVRYRGYPNGISLEVPDKKLCN